MEGADNIEELSWINNVNRSRSFGICISTDAYMHAGEYAYVHIQTSMQGLSKKNKGK